MVKIDHTNNLKTKRLRKEKTEPAVTDDRSGTEHESKQRFPEHIDTSNVATLPTNPTTGFDKTHGP